jgi:hypothetical protein
MDADLPSRRAGAPYHPSEPVAARPRVSGANGAGVRSGEVMGRSRSSAPSLRCAVRCRGFSSEAPEELEDTWCSSRRYDRCDLKFQHEFRDPIPTSASSDASTGGQHRPRQASTRSAASTTCAAPTPPSPSVPACRCSRSRACHFNGNAAVDSAPAKGKNRSR